MFKTHSEMRWGKSPQMFQAIGKLRIFHKFNVMEPN